jgi:hypothetical protein
MLMLLMMQGAQQAVRARYWAGARFVWLLLAILLVVGIVLVVKKIMK